MTKNAENRIGTQLKRRSRTRRETLVDQVRAERGRSPPRNDLSPDLRLETRPIASLSRATRRLRKADAAHVTRVRNAIATLGFCAPIMISSQGEVLDGHARLDAAAQLGLTEVPCIIVDHLSQAEQRLLSIALNRLPERASWDLDVLRLEMTELLELEAPLEVTGFDLEEIDQILLDEEPDPENEEELAPDPDAPPVCRLGDVWRLGRHLIVCGDARDPQSYSPLFAEGERAQLVLTDPPYNVPVQGHVTSGEHREFAMAAGEMTSAEFADFNTTWMQAALAHLEDGGLLAPFIDWRSIASMIRAGEDLGLSLLNLVVWAKSNGGMGSLWRSQHELLPVLKKGKEPHRNNVELGRHGRWRSNVWSYPGASSMGSDARDGLKDHPTTKPVAMLEDALLDVTNRDDVVLDPFLGSGSTLIAAEGTGRTCRAIELDPLYVDVAIRRWMARTEQEPECVHRAPQPDENSDDVQQHEPADGRPRRRSASSKPEA